MEEIYQGNNFVIMAGIVYRKNYMGDSIIGSYVSWYVLIFGMTKGYKTMRVKFFADL